VIGIIRRYKVKVSSTYKFSYFQGIGGQHCLHTAIYSSMLIAF